MGGTWRLPELRARASRMAVPPHPARRQGGDPERAASVAQIGQPSGALLRAILKPSAPLAHAAPFNQSEADDLSIPPKACGSRTPRPDRYSYRRQRMAAKTFSFSLLAPND